MKTVEYTLDTLPPLTEAQKEDLKRLAALPEEEIDTSDIPEMADGPREGMKRGLFYRPVKQQVTVRVDADVLAWLKSAGRGYQSRMNAILRQAMLGVK